MELRQVQLQKEYDKQPDEGKRIMSRFLENFSRRILYAGLSKEEYELIQGDLQEENRKSYDIFGNHGCISAHYVFAVFCK